MTWRRLIPTSLACALVIIAVMTTSAPSLATAETADCGTNDGDVCHQNCYKENADGSCKGWQYDYYPK